MKKAKGLLKVERHGEVAEDAGAVMAKAEEKKGATVLQYKTLPAVTIRRATARCVAANKDMADGSQVTIGDEDMGQVEITRAGNFFLFGLLDYSFRMLTYDAEKGQVVSDSEEKANVKQSEKMDEKGVRTMAILNKNKKASKKSPATKEKETKTPKAPKAPKVHKDAVLVTQMGYDGKPEQVDKNHYCNKIACAVCGKARYVANADKHQVTKCKPCQKKKSGDKFDKLKASKAKVVAVKTKGKK